MPTKISAIGLAVTAILIIAFVNGFIPQQPSPYEDVEWKSFKGYSYAFIKDSMGWEEARKQCQLMDGDLASIHSREENDFIYELVKLPNSRRDNFTRGEYPWIGLTKVKDHGDWKWSDDTPMDFQSWDPHCMEPTVIPPERCGEAEKVDGGIWAVECDTVNRGFVCKKPAE